MRWSASTRSRFFVVLMFAGAAPLGAQSHASERFESPGVLLATDVLPERLLRSVSHRVGTHVKLDDNLLQMELTTDFGVSDVTSVAMLEIRIREFSTLFQAIAQYERHNAQLAGEIRGRLRIGPDAGVRELSPSFGSRSDLSNQLTTNDTILSARGLGLSRQALPDVPRVGAEGPVYELHRRSVAYQLHLDPYSTNPQVQRFLETVANARSHGRFSAGSGLILSVSDPTSRLVDGGRIDAEVSSLLRHLDLEELFSGLEQELLAMGASATATENFLGLRQYSPRMKVSIVAHLDYLGEITGRGALIVAALGARSEAEALSFEQFARMLALYHERVGPIAQLVPGGDALPGALRKDRGLVLLLPVDYMYWTSEGKSTFDSLRSADGVSAGRPVDLVVRGLVTPRARLELETRGVNVHDSFLVIR